ncbi:hypothetical protein Taro_017337 [Colocasia esculenta]|uniref:Uncharacterized protein n=1 Tax=Colocasia esculenta TaxID=4460 RepID=A0A843UQX4_COLES|nr:hypothetical protein [Colocasia esculenta]
MVSRRQAIGSSWFYLVCVCVCACCIVEPTRFQFLGSLLRGVGHHATGGSSSAPGAEESGHSGVGPAWLL